MNDVLFVAIVDSIPEQVHNFLCLFLADFAALILHMFLQSAALDMLHHQHNLGVLELEHIYQFDNIRVFQTLQHLRLLKHLVRLVGLQVGRRHDVLYCVFLVCYDVTTEIHYAETALTQLLHCPKHLHVGLIIKEIIYSN